LRSVANADRWVSRWLDTATYSLTAIDNDPATTAATPATSSAKSLTAALATPTTMLAVETIPSFAPITPARNQLSRLAIPLPRSRVRGRRVDVPAKKCCPFIPRAAARPAATIPHCTTYPRRCSSAAIVPGWHGCDASGGLQWPY